MHKVVGGVFLEEQQKNKNWQDTRGGDHHQVHFGVTVRQTFQTWRALTLAADQNKTRANALKKLAHTRCNGHLTCARFPTVAERTYARARSHRLHLCVLPRRDDDLHPKINWCFWLHCTLHRIYLLSLFYIHIYAYIYIYICIYSYISTTVTLNHLQHPIYMISSLPQ